MTAISRRNLLGRGAAAAGAAALPTSLLSAEVAFAQEDAETDALERLIELERAAELALSLAAEESKLSDDAERAFEDLSFQNGEHTTALEQALESLGVDPPETQSDPADFDLLDDLDLEASQDELLEFMIGLEADLVSAYEKETANLDAGDLFRTAAQVGASHAQHLVVLRLLTGDSARGLTALPPSPKAASDHDGGDTEETADEGE